LRGEEKATQLFATAAIQHRKVNIFDCIAVEEAQNTLKNKKIQDMEFSLKLATSTQKKSAHRGVKKMN
jgi:hypothetical protein